MGRINNKEFYKKRMQVLANINNSNPINESANSITNNSLIDYKKAEDGIVYGIVKENHNYYIKRAIKSTNPDVADFVYINGLENIKDYQYKSLGEAEKQLNLHLINITEAFRDSRLINNTKFTTKPLLSEAKDPEIEKLDAATEKEKEEKKNTEPIPEEITDTETAPTTTETSSETEPSESESTEEGGDDLKKEIEKLIGKVGEKVSKVELSPEKTNTLLNTIIGYFKDDLATVDVEDRKKMSDKILKVVPDSEKTLENNLPESEIKENDEITNECSECGSFDNYANSRGYEGGLDKISSQDELVDLIAGYANAHEAGKNAGDFEKIVIFMTPEVINSLKNDYGHTSYVEKAQPYLDKVSEDKFVKAKGKSIYDTMCEDEEEEGNLLDGMDEPETSEIPVTEPVVPEADNDAQKKVEINLNDGTINVSLSESQIREYIRKRLNEIKNGITPINESNKPKVLIDLDNYIDKKYKITESKGKVNEIFGLSNKEKFQKLNPNDEKAVNDFFIKTFGQRMKKMNALIQAFKKMNTAEKYEILKNAYNDNFGGTVIRSDNSGLLKYVDSSKAGKLYKSQFAGGGTQGVFNSGGMGEGMEKSNKETVDEGIFGDNYSEKFSKLDPHNANDVNALFDDVFKNILTNKQLELISRLAKVETPEAKYEILKAASADGKPFKGTLRANPDGSLKYMSAEFRNSQTPSNFSAGGTQGKTGLGGV